VRVQDLTHRHAWVGRRAALLLLEGVGLPASLIIGFALTDSARLLIDVRVAAGPDEFRNAAVGTEQPRVFPCHSTPY
jgi:hypothetical protein